jgi:subtilisin family serine protease
MRGAEDAWMPPTVRRLAPLALALLIQACAGPAASPPPAVAPPAAEPGEIVVVFAPDAPQAAREALRARHAVGAPVPLTRHGEWWRVPVGTEATVAAALAGDPLVKHAGPNLRRPLRSPAPAVPPAVGFRLAAAERPWHLDHARFPAAWAAGRGGGIVVAVVDSGVDATHPDLAPRLAPMVDVVAMLGRADVLGGEDYAGRDGNGHGTFVAGLVVGQGATLGDIGGAPDATVLPIKVARANGFLDDAAIARGITAAVAGGADVVNLSVGGPEPSPLLLEALAEAFERGIPVVAASGNEAEPVGYPAGYHGVIAVGALAADDSVPWYSNRGPALVLGAPGGDRARPLRGTWPTYLASRPAGLPAGYAEEMGTSMASPLVAAAAALLLAAEPRLTGPQVLTRLGGACRDVGAPGYDPDSGWGALDVPRLLGR